MNFKYKLGIIGAGNMAKAIANGIVGAELIERDRIIACDPSADLGIDGVETRRENDEVLANSEYILLAVKPQIFRMIATELSAKCRASHVISIMAGITYDMLKDVFGDTHVTRVMPNTPCKLKLGMTAIRREASIPDIEREFVESIFRSIGDVVYLDEDMFHTITSVSGSGPAYVYMFIEGMIKSAIGQGLSEEDAKRAVLKTFEGAVAMVREESAPIAQLIDMVCSKGGTTIEAVESFRADNLYGIIDSAMIKCRNRSEELAK